MTPHATPRQRQRDAGPPVPLRAHVRACRLRRGHDAVRLSAGLARAQARAGQALEPPPAAHPRRRGQAARRHRRARRQRADRRQPHFLARHLRAELGAPGALRREVGTGAVAGHRRDDPRRGHAVHRAHASAATPAASTIMSPQCWRAATSSRSFRKARPRMASTCCRSRVRCCSPSWRRKAMCSRWPFATARPTARCRSRPRTSARRRSRNRSGMCAALARSPSI